MKVAPSMPVVAIVKVIGYTSFSNRSGGFATAMEVEVIEMLKGSEVRNKLTIWGDDGHLCRPYISQFKVDSSYVIALYNGSPSSELPNEKETDYAVAVCGAYWLDANTKDGTATGHIVGDERKVTTIALEQIKADLQKNSR